MIPVAESIWTRQRTAAPARETLTRDQIVRTAMERSTPRAWPA